MSTVTDIRGNFSDAEIEAGRRLFAGSGTSSLRGRLARFAAAHGGTGDRLRGPLQRRQIELDQRAYRPSGARPHLEQHRAGRRS